MISQLISHIWKKEFRSPVWAKSLLTNIFLGFAALMMLGYVLIAGIALDKIIREFFPDNDPVSFVNGFLFYYFFIQFVLRFMLQNVPVLEIQPYLHLPIKKGRIIHFMFRKSIFSVFNLLAILLFLPFSIIRISSDFGAASGFGWFAALVGLAVTLHFVVILFKKKMNDVPNLFIVLVGSLSIIVALDYFSVVSFSALSASVFDYIMQNPALGAIPVVLAFVFYRLNYNFLIKNTYPEELATKKKEKVTGDFGFLKQYGRMGELIQLELKLIIRHKRPRNTLIMSAFLLLYGLIFYTNDTYQDMQFIFMFAGVFITGIFFINYGQFLLSWESGYFDFILTRKVTFRQFVESKYWLFVATSTIAFVVSLAYGYFGWKIVLINLVAYMFNIGLNVFAVMRLAMISPKKIDLTKGAAFNYEGVGAAQFLIMIPMMILPYLLYAPFLILGYENIGLLLTGLAGLIGFLFRDKTLNALTQFFISRRHKFAASFRSQ